MATRKTLVADAEGRSPHANTSWASGSARNNRRRRGVPGLLPRYRRPAIQDGRRGASRPYARRGGTHSQILASAAVCGRSRRAVRDRSIRLPCGGAGVRRGRNAATPERKMHCARAARGGLDARCTSTTTVSGWNASCPDKSDAYQSPARNISICQCPSCFRKVGAIARRAANEARGDVADLGGREL